MARKVKEPRAAAQTAWNLSPLFRGDDDPAIEKKLSEVEKRSRKFIEKWKNRTDYLKDATALREALDDYEEWKKSTGTDGDPGYYFWLRTQQDLNDPVLKARYNKVEDFGRDIENQIQFFYLRLAKIPEKFRKKFLSEPPLAPYRHYLERVFAEADYLLSEAEEKVLNLKSATSYSNWVRMTSGFLSREERKILLEDGSKGVKPFSEIASLMNSRNKKVRDGAAAAFQEIIDRNLDVAEAEINSILANKKTDDELRKMDRPDLSRHIGDDIDTDVVDTLVRAVSDRFDIPESFYRLKAKLMNVKKLKYHERNVEYGNVELKFPYPKASRLVLKVFNAIDPEFAGIYERFTRNGQLDIYPKKGKSGGAFCAHHLISQPTYILLNHTGRLHDVLTLAHELGHGINNELIRKAQNATNFGTPTSTAEVASTFMEDFVLQEIMKTSDEELRLSLMMMKLNEDISTIFRQVACYRFEQELHSEFRKKGYLSKEEIGGLFRSHMSAYMGESVEQSKGSENWWVYWSHIRYFFYVYSYASGLLISKSLQNSVKRDPRFTSKVKDFLSAGLADSPRNIFRKLGIDITDRTFWEKGIEEIEALLKETTSLAIKLGKIREA